MKEISLLSFSLGLILSVCPYKKKIVGDWVYLGTSQHAASKANIDNKMTNLERASIYSYREDGTFLFDFGDYKRQGDFFVTKSHLIEKTRRDTMGYEIILLNDTIMSMTPENKVDTFYFFRLNGVRR